MLHDTEGLSGIGTDVAFLRVLNTITLLYTSINNELQIKQAHTFSVHHDICSILLV